MKRAVLLILKKLIRMLLLLLAVSAVTFALVSLSPIDPLQANVGQAALGTMSEEQREKLEEYWGVNEPPLKRYLGWLSDALRGDMGTSLLYRRPVWEVIGEKLENSLLLLAVSWLLSGILGFALGVAAVFWLALLLLLVFAVQLGLFPVALSVPIGMDADQVTLADRLYHAVLPALTLSITGVSNIALHTREKMIEVMESDYMLFARARGERKWRRIRRHGLRNLLLPAITLQFASVSEIIGGSVMVEQVFSWPGLGQAAVTAGLGSDVPLLMGITVVTAAIVFAGNFLADLLYGVVDPRMRRGRREKASV